MSSLSLRPFTSSETYSLLYLGKPVNNGGTPQKTVRTLRNHKGDQVLPKRNTKLLTLGFHLLVIVQLFRGMFYILRLMNLKGISLGLGQSFREIFFHDISPYFIQVHLSPFFQKYKTKAQFLNMSSFSSNDIQSQLIGIVHSTYIHQHRKTTHMIFFLEFF